MAKVHYTENSRRVDVDNFAARVTVQHEVTTGRYEPADTIEFDALFKSGVAARLFSTAMAEEMRCSNPQSVIERFGGAWVT